MKVVSVVNQKGGCGKTVTSVNLAAALAKNNYKVLLIDLDPQGHTTFSLKRDANFTITDILEKVYQNQEIPQEGIYTPISAQLYLIPSSVGLASLEYKLASQANKLQILSTFLKNIPADFDYIILDCPPNLGLLTLNALVASTYCLIPLMMCDFSLKGMEILENIFIMLKDFNGKTPIPLYLLNQVDKRSRFGRQFTEKVRKQLGDMLLATHIRTNIHLREAASMGKDIFNHKPDSRGAEDFNNLANEVERITSSVNWAPLFFKARDIEEVYAIGDFNNWQKKNNYKLKKVADDIWSINLSLEKGKYRYKFLAGNTWVADPHNKLAEDDSFGGKNSLIIIE